MESKPASASFSLTILQSQQELMLAPLFIELLPRALELESSSCAPAGAVRVWQRLSTYVMGIRYLNDSENNQKGLVSLHG